MAGSGSQQRHPAEVDDANDEELDFFDWIYQLKRMEEEEERRQREPLQGSHAQRLVRRAIDDIQRLIEGSSLKRDSDTAIAEFDLDEIEVGTMLGAGGFARVHEVLGFHPKSSKEVTPEVQVARDFFVQLAVRESGECRFAMKHLRRNLARQPEKFASGMLDLAMEAHFMAALDHPNILKIRGIAAAGPKALLNGQCEEYFIIVDKLEETLDERIATWKKQVKRLNRCRPFGRAKKRDAKRKQLLLEQLKVAYDIASGVEYLHSKGVIHRDIKSSNCGVDAHGDCKLFDFGLAAEIRISDDGLPCQLNDNVGSSRYIAPEVVNGEGYDVKADVYSYAITLYEILSLSRPWGQRNLDKRHINEILCLDEDTYEAPSVCSSWPVAIQTMLVRAWSMTSSERPSMSEICDILRLEIEKIQDDDPSVPVKRPAARRRSSFSGYLASFNEYIAEREVSPEDSVNTRITLCTSSGSHDF